MEMIDMIKIMMFAEILLSDDNNGKSNYFDIPKIDQDYSKSEDETMVDIDLSGVLFDNDECVGSGYTFLDYDESLLRSTLFDYDNHKELENYDLTLRNFMKLEDKSMRELKKMSLLINKKTTEIRKMINDGIYDVNKYEIVMTYLCTAARMSYRKIKNYQTKRIEKISYGFLNDIMKNPDIDKQEIIRAISSMNVIAKNTLANGLDIMCTNSLYEFNMELDNILILIKIINND